MPIPSSRSRVGLEATKYERGLCAGHSYPSASTEIESFYLTDVKHLKTMAERTGLEPATPGVTGRYSNQLNYRSDELVGVAGIEPATSGL